MNKIRRNKASLICFIGPFQEAIKIQIRNHFYNFIFLYHVTFWINFQFPSKSFEFILSPKFPANDQWAQFSNVNSRPGSTELWKASSLITNLWNPVPNNKIRMKMGFFEFVHFERWRLFPQAFWSAATKTHQNRLYSRYAMNI